jgi:hypothetical protein
LVNADIHPRVTLPLDKAIVKHAFLPPVMSEEESLPPAILKKLEADKSAGKIIFCSNAWRLDTYNNQDLYGLDLCIEVTKRLIDKGFAISFVFNVSTIDKFQALYDHYQKMIVDYQLQDHFLLISERMSFVRLMEKSDIVLRPTNTDGDSLSIREALFLHKPILASDIVERPQGTILFKSRDIDDMEAKILKTMSEITELTSKVNTADDSSYKEFYTSLIRNMFLKANRVSHGLNTLPNN